MTFPWGSNWKARMTCHLPMPNMRHGSTLHVSCWRLTRASPVSAFVVTAISPRGARPIPGPLLIGCAFAAPCRMEDTHNEFPGVGAGGLDREVLGLAPKVAARRRMAARTGQIGIEPAPRQTALVDSGAAGVAAGGRAGSVAAGAGTRGIRPVGAAGTPAGADLQPGAR